MRKWLFIWPGVTLFVLLLIVYVCVSVKKARLNRDLSLAVLTDNLTGAQTALDHGADPNGWGSGTDLEAVLYFQRLRLFLWKTGILEPQAHTMPVLILAASGDHPAIVRLLLRHGADPNIRGRFGETPLMIAATFSDSSCVLSLLAGGADIHATDNQSRTAYGWAAGAGKKRHSNLKVLKKAGA